MGAEPPLKRNKLSPHKQIPEYATFGTLCNHGIMMMIPPPTASVNEKLILS